MHFGLIGAGPVSQYLAGKLPGLGKQLGPVAASNHRSASRIVNTLRAGVAMRDISGLAQVNLILVCAPGHHLRALLPILLDSDSDWSNKSVVLCNSTSFSEALNHLRSRGASVASLRPLWGLPRHYLLEGDKQAARAARHLVRELGGTPLEIRPESAPLYCASVTFANSLFTPLLEASVASIRATGISGSARCQILEASFRQTLRMFLYSGQKSWAGTVAARDESAMAEQIDALRSLDPRLANLYSAIARNALELFKSKRPRRKPLEKS